MVDFTTLHPFDFDRNLFNFLVCDPFFFFSEVQINIMHLLSHLCFHHWFSFPVVDGFSLLLTILNLYLKIIVMLYISARLRMLACSAYEPRPHLFVDLYSGYDYLSSAEW